ncbi:MAG: DegT/DnrJ/EryC1/StrS family aminotransferase [Pseudomonadota bacterium]
MEREWISLSEPDIDEPEIELVTAALRSRELSGAGLVEAFEREFAAYAGRRHAIAVSSGTMGMLATLLALRLEPDSEVVVPAYSWHHTAHAVVHAGLKPQLADIDYWSGCIDAAKLAERITPRTRALIACNANGHPAAWPQLRALAERHGLILLEDSSEAIGSRLAGRLVGSFGDVAVFDFSQPGALCCGEGAMVVTDDETLASEIAYHRARKIKDRISISVGSRVPLQCGISEVTAAIGLMQLKRLDAILARRKQIESWYHEQVQTFEGIKPPYIADDVSEIHWMLYIIHLGKRFTLSARNQIVEDLADAGAIEVAPYCVPLQSEFHYQRLGFARGQFPISDRIADRALALPFHGNLDEDQIRFVVKTLKEACTNVGAGVPIY